MKILIVNSIIPFQRGPVDALASALETHLVDGGHQAEVLRLPCNLDDPARAADQLLMVRALELSNVDRVIALDLPAGLIRHGRKTLWLAHLPEAGGALLDKAGQQAISESARVFCSAAPVRQALLDRHGSAPALLRAPLADPGLYQNGDAGDYLFAGGPIDTGHALLLQALARADARIELVLAGATASATVAKHLEAEVARLGLLQRVRLMLAPLPEAEHARLLRNAGAVICVNEPEAAATLALQAAHAGKPILATGVCAAGLARHRQSGWVVEPRAEALADAMDQYLRYPQWRTAYGEHARALPGSTGWNWRDTIEALLA